MKPLFIHYPKCSTCRKAAIWLKEHSINVLERDIVLNNPTADELAQWIKLSGMPIRNFFNTSGLKYRELGLKDILPNSSQEKLIGILSSDGMLVKRPLLISEHYVLTGFNEVKWKSLLL